MDKKHIYKLIRNFEFEAGESFTDQNESIVNDRCLMFWMLGRGYINGTKIDAYAKASFTELNNVLCGYEQEFSLFPYGETEEECHFKSMEILSELIAESKIYQDRLLKIMNEHEEYSSYVERDEYLEKEYNLAVSLSINELNEKYKS